MNAVEDELKGLRDEIRSLAMAVATGLGRVEAKIDVCSAQSRVGGQPATTARFPRLTTKQHAALQMLLGGRSNADIATRFGVSINTAKVYVRGLASHFGVTTRTQIVLSAKAPFEAIGADDYVVQSGGLPKDWDQNYREPDPYRGLYAYYGEGGHDEGET